MIYGQKEIQPHNFQDYFGPLRWHYPDQVIRVFLSLHAEGHPESFGYDNKSQYEDGNVQRTCCKRGKPPVLQQRCDII